MVGETLAPFRCKCKILNFFLYCRYYKSSKIGEIFVQFQMDVVKIRIVFCVLAMTGLL